MTPRQFLAVAVFTLLGNCAALAAYHYAMSPRWLRVGVVDLAAVYRVKEAQFSAQIGKGDPSEAGRKRAVEDAQRFALALPAQLEALSAQCGCVVLAANAVASRPAQVVDLTPDLLRAAGL